LDKNRGGWTAESNIHVYNPLENNAHERHEQQESRFTIAFAKKNNDIFFTDYKSALQNNKNNKKLDPLRKIVISHHYIDALKHWLGDFNPLTQTKRSKELEDDLEELSNRMFGHKCLCEK
jgi:hypothetical protein